MLNSYSLARDGNTALSKNFQVHEPARMVLTPSLWTASW